MFRTKTKKINIGNTAIGGGAPVAIQSMTTTKTKDTETTIRAIRELEKVGCEIIRVAVFDQKDAAALGEIKKNISIPLVADIHFDYRLALAAIEQGIDKLRINPGNIGGLERVRKVTEARRPAGKRTSRSGLGLIRGRSKKTCFHYTIKTRRRR